MSVITNPADCTDMTQVRAGVDRELVARLYEDLIETSIAHELVRWDVIREA